MTPETPSSASETNIAQNWQQILKNDFPVGRGLRRKDPEAGTSYFDYRGFGPILRKELISLKENEVWIDIGAGELFAQAEFFLKGYSHGKAIAISVRDPDTKEFQENLKYLRRLPFEKFLYLSGRRVEEIPAQELPPAKIVSDLFGALSFTEQIDSTLQKELEMLKPGGIFVARLQKAYIKDVSGRRFGIRKYLASVVGAEILFYGWHSLAMKRTVDKVNVPKLRLVNFISGESALNPNNMDPNFLFCERYYLLEK